MKWKQESVVDNYCKSQNHISVVNNYNDKKKIKYNTACSSTAQISSDFRRQVIEDLLDEFIIANISFEIVNKFYFLKGILKIVV